MAKDKLNAEELKTKTPDELKKLLLDQKKSQFNLRFQHGGGQLDNTSEVRKTRRTIARIKTFLNAKPTEGKAAPKKAPAKKSSKKAA